VLLIDSRVVIDPAALRYLASATRHATEPVAFNGFVLTDDRVPLVGRFWDVPVWLFWGGYLSSPSETRITAQTFDRLPKGLGMFYAPREWLVDAMKTAWPATDPRLVSDDTKVIRRIAEADDLRITPQFAGSYRPRVSVGAFLAHARMRGTLFVDSYAGTSTLRGLVMIGLVAAPVVFLIAVTVAILFAPWVAVAFVAVAVIALITPAVVAVARHCRIRSIRAYLAYVVPFAVVFWIGLARGVIVHRRAFLRQKTNEGITA